MSDAPKILARRRTKVAMHISVRKHTEGCRVELRCYDDLLVSRAYTKGSYNETNVDLGDQLQWVQIGPGESRMLVNERDQYAPSD